ncbi:MAG: hypothetical protein HQ592_00480 [Planctomycetes bacterium]|nr:hypothetical protein [Planctomycetota bacterium]
MQAGGATHALREAKRKKFDIRPRRVTIYSMTALRRARVPHSLHMGFIRRSEDQQSLVKETKVHNIWYFFFADLSQFADPESGPAAPLSTKLYYIGFVLLWNAFVFWMLRYNTKALARMKEAQVEHGGAGDDK